MCAAIVKYQSSVQNRIVKHLGNISSQIENTSNFEQYCIDVEFSEELLSTEKIAAEISLLSNPHIIMWYIGCYGLRQAGVQFYKNFLTAPILRQNKEARFWLVDLTAWNAFKNPQSTVQKSSRFCDDIEKFSNDRINCIRSAEIFKKMQQFSERDIIEYFKGALRREFICQASKDFPNKNIRTGAVFLDNCPIMSDWYEHDVSKSYSVFQYFEGCLIVDTIFTQLAMNGLEKDIQIVFVLPNDEFKYYKDQCNSFRKDIQFLISKRCAALNVKMVNLHIKFLAFRYGAQLQDRPYNANGNVLKNGNLFCEDVIGSFEELKNQ